MLEEKLTKAATIMFLHSDIEGLWVLMVKRNPAIKFAGGHYAFPGGKLEKEDYGQDENDLNAAKNAIIRECFEEIGYNNLKAENIFALARWQPPPPIIYKFDTYFFITEAKEKFTPIIDNNEIIEAHWLRPQRAIDMINRNEIKVLFPTIQSLYLLRDYDNFKQLHQLIDFIEPPVINTKMRDNNGNAQQYIDCELESPLYQKAFLNYEYEKLGRK